MSKEAWQERLLPLMSRMVIGLTIFFFVITLGQLLYLHWTIRTIPSADFSSAYEILAEVDAQDDEKLLEAFEARALVMLELEALERRYHQASVILMSSVWIKYLGFVTGMILALVGAAFALGKLTGPPAKIGAEGGGVKGHLETASPGIILIALGVALMIATLVTKHTSYVRDAAVYTSGLGVAVAEQNESLGEKPNLGFPNSVKE